MIIRRIIITKSVFMTASMIIKKNYNDGGKIARDGHHE